MANAPYSQGIKVTGGTLVFLTGQTPRDPKTHETVHKGDIEGQTRQALDNLKNLVEAAGATLGDVVQLRVYYKSADYVQPVLKIRREYFTTQPFPTVTGLVCDLTDPDMLIEFEAIAVI
jgi:2-iminobutanoate/2-iminopropanoate deaminase